MLATLDEVSHPHADQQVVGVVGALRDQLGQLKRADVGQRGMLGADGHLLDGREATVGERDNLPFLGASQAKGTGAAAGPGFLGDIESEAWKGDGALPKQ